MRTLLVSFLFLCLAAPAPAGMRDDQRLITGARGQLMPVVEAALEAGAKIDARDAARRTALMWAAFHGNAMTPFLIARGADVNARDGRGRTPLMWAALAGRSGAAEALLAAGADAALADNAGGDAAAHAAAGGHAALAERLATAAAAR